MCGLSYIEKDAPVLTSDLGEHPPRWKCLFIHQVVLGPYHVLGTVLRNRTIRVHKTIKYGLCLCETVVWKKQAAKKRRSNMVHADL